MKNKKEIKKGTVHKYYLMYVLKELDNNAFSKMQCFGIVTIEQLVIKEAIKILKKEKAYKEIVIDNKFSFSYIDAREDLMKVKEFRLLTPYKEITSEEFYKLKAITNKIENCQLIISKEFLAQEQVFLLQFKGKYSYLHNKIWSPYIQI